MELTSKDALIVRAIWGVIFALLATAATLFFIFSKSPYLDVGYLLMFLAEVPLFILLLPARFGAKLLNGIGRLLMFLN